MYFTSFDSESLDEYFFEDSDIYDAICNNEFYKARELSKKYGLNIELIVNLYLTSKRFYNSSLEKKSCPMEFQVIDGKIYKGKYGIPNIFKRYIIYKFFVEKKIINENRIDSLLYKVKEKCLFPKSEVYSNPFLNTKLQNEIIRKYLIILMTLSKDDLFHFTKKNNNY